VVPNQCIPRRSPKSNRPGLYITNTRGILHTVYATFTKRPASGTFKKRPLPTSFRKLSISRASAHRLITRQRSPFLEIRLPRTQSRPHPHPRSIRVRAMLHSTSPTREGTVSLHAFVAAQLSHGIKIGPYHVQRKAEMSVRAAHPQSESAQLRIRTPQRPRGLKSRPRVNAHKAHPIKSGKIGRISASSFRLSVRKS
jgi:hypothetical protein